MDVQNFQLILSIKAHQDSLDFLQHSFNSVNFVFFISTSFSNASCSFLYLSSSAAFVVCSSSAFCYVRLPFVWSLCYVFHQVDVFPFSIKHSSSRWKDCLFYHTSKAQLDPLNDIIHHLLSQFHQLFEFVLQHFHSFHRYVMNFS